MSFQQGLSGLNTSSTNLDVIGNNIANVNTVGFKQSQAQFTDVFANSLSGSGSSQVGIGAKVATIAQTFSQGNITQTNNPLDIAINGQGFFRMSDGGAISYSRDGQFRADGNGFITNSRGLNLTGYMADASGNIIASGPTNLKLSTSDLAPKPTSSYAVGVNLDSRLDLPAVATFDATNPQSYNKTTSGTVVDSLGNSHQFALFFQKTAANTWNTFATIDGKVDAAGLPIGVTLGGAASQALQFDSTGAIDPAATPFTVS
ncbi:MAG: flagellar hook-basal body complex protein, partial [Nitrosomonas sp.]